MIHKLKKYNNNNNSCHIFYASRVVDVRDGKDKWAGMNGTSDLLDDEGNVIRFAS